MEQNMKQREALANYNGDDKVITFEEKRAELKDIGAIPWAIETDIKSLDCAIEGFRPGDLIVVSGPTAHGKTSFLQSITFNVAGRGIPSLWFPFEGDIGNFLERLHGVSTEGSLPKTLKSNNLAWIKHRIEEAILKYGARVVFIDHLHYLLSLESMGGNTSLIIGGIVRRLKLIAQELNVVIFLVCHIRKLQPIDKKGIFAKPSIDDLRDSSLVGQEADYVILMWRKQAEGSTIENPIWLNKAQISLQKNRRTGKLVNFSLEMKGGLFCEGV